MLHGRPREQVVHWAVHPGGRSVLDAVERALEPTAGARGFARRCCAATATCPRRPSSSCSRPCSRAAFPGPAARSPSAPAWRSRACCSRCSGDWSGERSRAPELMDSERVDLATFEACLKDPRADQPLDRRLPHHARLARSIAQGPRAAAARSGRHRLRLRRHAAPHRHLGRDARRRSRSYGGRSQSLATTIAARATPSTPVRYLTADVRAVVGAALRRRDQLLVRSSSR